MDKIATEVAEILGISRRRVRTLIQQNRLLAEKRRRDYFVKEEDIELMRKSSDYRQTEKRNYEQQ